jgi:hypothetical protein
MIWLLIVLLILLFLFTLIIFTKLTILINYFHHNENDDLKIEFRIWFGLIKYKINVPLIKIDNNSPSVVVKSNSKMGSSSTKEKNSEQKVTQIEKNDITTSLENAKELLYRVVNLHLIVRKFFKKVTLKQLEWHSIIGVGDAAHTGTITGAIWAIKGSIIGMLSQYIKLKEMPNLTVTPHFQLAIIHTRLSCIFQFRIGHAILAGLKLIKFWRGGLPHFKTNTNFSKEKTKSV